MANHLRGEAEFSFTTVDGDEHSYTLNFNNQAKMAIEADLGMTSGNLIQEFGNSNGEAARIRFALLRHGLRKHHRKQFKEPTAISDLLEEFDIARASADDGGEALAVEFLAALLSAYDRQPKQRFLDLFSGELDEDESDEEEPGKGSAARGRLSEVGSDS